MNIVGRLETVKMLEDKIYNIDNEEGIKLIEKGKYEDAINFFESRLYYNDYLVYYGLATAVFKDKSTNMSKEKIERIIKLYRKSIERNPDFADANLMLGMAYEQIVSILINEYKKNPYINSENKINEIKNALSSAKELIKKSVKLNPLFNDIANSELDNYERRLRGIDGLKRYYEQNIHSN